MRHCAIPYLLFQFCCRGVLAASAPDPTDIAVRTINKFIFNDSSFFYEYEYGSALLAAAAYQAADVLGHPEWTQKLDATLIKYMTNKTQRAYKILNNITMPFDYAVGDITGKCDD